jgi:hypothetical protein
MDPHLAFARALIAATLLAGALLGASASAQDVYPSKPITLIVPFPPGGVADIVARPAADALGRVLGAPVVIENKAGAGGGIGMAYVAKAKPDGYTLLLALSSVSILPEADKIIGRAPMYQLDQLVPRALEIFAWQTVDRAVQLERVERGDVPLQLVTVSHDHRHPAEVVLFTARRNVPQNSGFAARGIEQACEHLQRRRFARAVRPQEADDLAGLDIE